MTNRRMPVVRRTTVAAIVIILAAIRSPAVGATPNKCVSTKGACVNKHAGTLLKCYAKAQKSGGEIDSECVTKANAKLEGCFDKIESKVDPEKPETVCRTSEDELEIAALLDEFTVEAACATNPLSCPSGTCAHSPCATGAALSASCNPCVTDICAQDVFAHCCTTSWDATCTEAVSRLCQLDCVDESPGPNKCVAAKTGCMNKRLAGLLKCYAKAQKKGTALDAECVQKVVDKFDGGAEPTKGCFAKIEAKEDVAEPETVCPVTFDTAAAETLVDRAVETLACELEDDNCPCCNGQCNGPLIDFAEHATHDTASGIACGHAYVARTSFNPACESTCGTCSFGETCIDGSCQAETRGRRCVAGFPPPACVVNDTNTCQVLEVPFTNNPSPLNYYFMEVDGYQDEPVWIHVRPSWDILATYYDQTPLPAPSDPPIARITFFSCDSTHGRFYSPLNTEFSSRQSDYDANGTITDLVHLDSNTNRQPTCTTFADGPSTLSSPTLAIDPDGQYYKFVPNPGVSGDGIAEMVIIVDDLQARTNTLESRSLPVPVLVYRINIRPRSEPIAAPAATELPGTGRYYEVVKTLLAWDNAKANAAARTYNGKTGHLAVIGDAVENEFVRSLASAAGATNPIYIGLGKYPLPGTFQWVNGDPLVYQNWDTTQPDNAGGVETVANMSPTSGKWSDQSLTTTRWYVVEYE